MTLEPKIQNNVKELKAVYQTALSQLGKIYAFKTVECLRTLERQKWLLSKGKSWTLNSNHLKGLAADLFPLPLGYKTPEKTWQKMHDDWDKIVRAMGEKPEPRIARDLGHFGIMSK